MKFTLSWLKEYLLTSASLDEICSKLTEIGLEVESVFDQSQSLSNFSVAEIIDTQPVPNSNKLKICQVKISETDPPLQIICGASNARSGIKVAYAPIGSLIPATKILIKKAKIAGIESCGMLCSAHELQISEVDSGIIEIDKKWSLGTKISKVFGMDDAIIDINITPNRADCLGIYGIARDLAAADLGELLKPAHSNLSPQFSFPLEINNQADSACKFAAFRYFKNVKNCPSPPWLKTKLNAAGINSISAIIDITNYVMLVLNRPMHAYDASKINGSLEIRFAKNGEEFLSLKEEKFSLDEKDLIIADQEKPLGIAGIIGSRNSACNFNSSEILLESAFFEPATISRSGRRLSLQTDARYRFERGVDIETCEIGIELASQLILEICGGEISEIKIIGQKPSLKKIIFDIGKIHSLTGIEVLPEKVWQILINLGFALEETDEKKLLVQIPSHRKDIHICEDLIEEVARIIGYQQIHPKKLPFFDKKSFINPLNRIRTHLASQGLSEIISWSFIDSNLAEIFGNKNERLELANPIASELNHLRPNLIIGLVQAYQKNSLRNFSNLSLFEIGNVFFDSSPNDQKLMIAGLRAGRTNEDNHYHDVRDFDVFDVKKDFLEVIEIFGINAKSLQINSAQPLKYYHPHRFAEFRLGKNLIGYCGEIHPLVAKKLNCENRLNVFEIFLDNLPKLEKSAIRKSFIINDLPLVERDFAFLIDKNQPVGEVIKTILSCEKELIKEVNIFDIYCGQNIAEGSKSIALRIFMQSAEKTLTKEEIDAVSRKVTDAVTKSFNAILREAS